MSERERERERGQIQIRHIVHEDGWITNGELLYKKWTKDQNAEHGINMSLSP